MNKQELYDKLTIEIKSKENKNNVQALRNIIAAFVNLEKSNQKIKDENQSIIKLIEKEINQDAEQIYYLKKSTKVDKENKIKDYNEQIAFLTQFVPTKMSYQELELFIKQMISDSEKELNIGEIFKIAKQELGDTFEGKDLNKIVKSL